MPRCVICNQSVEHWQPHPLIEHRSEVSRILRVVGSDLRVYGCPACGCNDRDRHLWLFLNAAGVLGALSSMRVLHIAPERVPEQLILAASPAEYVRGDLHPTRPDHVQLNVEGLPFEDGRFDLVLCNHVLEHVNDPALAVREMRRCLRPGGTLVAQTPYSPLLRRTLEINEPASPDFARLFFGQEDHVRLFGADIVDVFRQAGFDPGLPIPSEAVLPGFDPGEFGFNAREPFFAFTR